MRRLPERFELRLSRADREQMEATARWLGLTLSGYARVSIRERSALEAVLRKADDKEGGSTE
jgi:hypothetical protein